MSGVFAQELPLFKNYNVDVCDFTTKQVIKYNNFIKEYNLTDQYSLSVLQDYIIAMHYSCKKD